jgi:hypothetical protein
MKTSTRRAAALIAAALSAAPFVQGDEGMWTLDNLPVQQLGERYGFTPTPQWLEHVRLASVRFNDGGSGAFVSPNGLVVTNHHVALGQLQKMSTEKRDFIKDGFFARRPSEERPCPDLELNVLVSTENVTARVLGAVKADASEKVQNEQRKGEMARIEKESMDKTKLRSDVVELYQGGEYQLYRYKKYTDIRLVMAPEIQAAFYGGDPDNFTYPRYDLDMAFFRVYEDGKPLRPKEWFKWSKEGAKEGELVFVSGHPGSTDRLKTVKQLEYERDHRLPTRLEQLALRRKAYYDYSARGSEQARRAKDRIFGVENSIKAISGEYEGLQEPKLMAQKVQAEEGFRKQVEGREDLAKLAGQSWDRLAAADEKLVKRHRELNYRKIDGSKLAGFAQTIVRLVAEVEKPNEKRLEEFRDSALESLKFRLFSPAPIYPDMEEAMLGVLLRESLDKLGPEDPYVKAALGGQEPEAAAKALIGGTKLMDAEERKRLVAVGRKAVESSKDPLIVWARAIDPVYRELRKWYEDEVQSVQSLEGNKIAKARFALYGKSAYPDATFTLRLSYGRVAGYELGTTKVPYKTTFYGLYDRAASFDNKPPFDLSRMSEERKADVELSTPLDFVTTNDIIGGNSGSPVFNRDAEYVGLIFDGNIQSLVWRYAYTDERGRAVAVHSSGILEGLRKIYRMYSLADELTGASQ